MLFRKFIKRAFVLVLFLSVAVVAVGCGGKDSGETYAVPKDTVFSGGVADLDPVILSFGTTESDYIVDPYRIDQATIQGDELHIKVTYTGGCEEHLFELMALNDFLASQPAQAELLLTHDANRDNCEAVVNEELKFSLLSLKEEYRIALGTETGTLSVKLRDASKPDGSISIEYAF